jgi:DNA replication protein DnaC
MNTTAYDPRDHAAWLAEAQAEAAASRLEAFLGRRPAAFADPGHLRADVQAWTNNYLSGHHGSLILTGEIGTTKTWHLWKLNETLIRYGWTGQFRIATTYDVKLATDRPVDHEALTRWREADLYAIDDLGARAVNDWTADAISELIDNRWQNRRPTLVATNLIGREIRDVLGDRASSRLGDGATVAHFTGADRRKGNSK